MLVALTLVVAIFAGQSYLLANTSDTNPVNELCQWTDPIKEMNPKNREFLRKGLKRYLQNIQEFEAFNDPDSEGYSTLIRKIFPVIYEGCNKDLQKIEDGDYLKAFLEFYRPSSHEYQSLGEQQRELIDACYDCFNL